MGKSKYYFMDLNRETAMRLWNKSFGKEIKTTDFAGRTIVKGAYNDRNSEYGWNIDHILPQSKGGATADYNLVCCHILTNDEKADKFPCFNANGSAYEIIKVQNHYEIRCKNHKSEEQKEILDTVDFFDSAAGIRFLKKLKGIQNKKRFVGTVLVCLSNVSNNAVIDFIEKMFEDESISYDKVGYLNNEVRVKITNYNMPLKADSSVLLDKCVLLNTYLSSYFLDCGYIDGFDIYYRLDCFEKKSDMYQATFDFTSKAYAINNTRLTKLNTLRNSMFVNNLVLDNTEAGDKVERNPNSDYMEYNYIFTNLSKNLKKEVNGK